MMMFCKLVIQYQSFKFWSDFIFGSLPDWNDTNEAELYEHEK